MTIQDCWTVEMGLVWSWPFWALNNNNKKVGVPDKSLTGVQIFLAYFSPPHPPLDVCTPAHSESLAKSLNDGCQPVWAPAGWLDTVDDCCECVRSCFVGRVTVWVAIWRGEGAGGVLFVLSASLREVLGSRQLREKSRLDGIFAFGTGVRFGFALTCLKLEKTQPSEVCIWWVLRWNETI